MKKPVKKERHEIYKIALARIEKFISNFMCCAICDAYNIYYDVHEVNDVSETNFPELFKHKPKFMFGTTSVWFDIDKEGREKRIEILKQCINETR